MSGNINFNGWLNDDGSENYKCRAWVNFNGTSTVAIRASGNVSSITDNGTGDYTVNFTTAMADVNYCVVTQGTSSGRGYMLNTPKNGSSGNITTTQLALLTADFNGNTSDFEYAFVAIFR
jgi:hypothetical protein